MRKNLVALLLALALILAASSAYAAETPWNEDAGVSFIVPEGWYEEKPQRNSAVPQAEFVNGQGSKLIIKVADLYAIMVENGAQGLVRAEVNNGALSTDGIRELYESRQFAVNSVSPKTINNIAYFKVLSTPDRSAGGSAAELPSITHLLVYDGMLYEFSCSGEMTTDVFNAYNALLASIRYDFPVPTVPPAPTVAPTAEPEAGQADPAAAAAIQDPGEPSAGLAAINGMKEFAGLPTTALTEDLVNAYRLSAMLALLLCVLPVFLYRYALQKRPSPKRKALIGAAVYGVCMLALFGLYGYLSHNFVPCAAAFAWSFVNYGVLRTGSAQTVYFSREETPLRFHKFVRYGLLPFYMAVCLLYAFAPFLLNRQFEPVTAVFFLLLFALALACFVGFFRWKPYAWYAMMAFTAFLPLFHLLRAVVYVMIRPSELPEIISDLIASLFWMAPICLYYRMRKPLFVAPKGLVAQAPPQTVKRRCPVCDSPLKEHGLYCEQCGTFVDRKTTQVAKYVRKEQTPLKIHKFLHYAVLPILAFICLLALGKQVLFQYPLSSAEDFRSVIILALSIICLVGFSNWKPYAWYAFMALLLFAPVFYLYALFAQLVLFPYRFPSNAINLPVSTVISAALMIYYHNRKPLFFQSTMLPTAQTACPACGEPALAPDDAFCHLCGAKLPTAAPATPAEEAADGVAAAPCPHCEEPYHSPGAAFCHKCGKKLAVADVPVDEAGMVSGKEWL